MRRSSSHLAWFVCLIAAFACLLIGPARADGPKQLPFEAQYEKIKQLIEADKYDEAKTEAIELARSKEYSGLEFAGAVRSIIDAFRAHGKKEMADEVYVAANESMKPRGAEAIALQGGRADAAVLRSLPVFSRKLAARAIFNPQVDLKRVRTGNQASILKIMGPKNEVVFMKGLDGVLWAPINEEHRTKIFEALGIAPASLDATAMSLMEGYPRYKEKVQAIAVLGALGSGQLSDATFKRLLGFLVQRMNNEKDHAIRRQSVLALALLSATDTSTINAVVSYYKTNGNLWETFPVQQFFEYHSARLHKLSDLASLRTQVQAIDCIYTPNIIKFL